MAKAVKEKEMKVSLEALKKVIQDYETYPEFLPEVVGAKVISREGADKAQVQFDINVIKRFQYTLKFWSDSPNTFCWKLIESDVFKTNEGKWTLSSTGPHSTLAKYELEVGFGFFVPGFVTKGLTESNLPALLDRFEAQAKKVDL
jgi:coenzyme Q-binding protein COQ10